MNAANGRLMFIGQITVRTVGAGGTAIANIAGMSAVGWATVVFGSGGPSVAVDTTVANLIEFTFISGAAGANMVFQTATWNLQKW